MPKKHVYQASISLSSWNLSMMPRQKEGETDLLFETSKSTSNDSEDIGIIEDIPIENIYEGETSESPPREAVSLFSAILGPSTEHNTENEEPASTHDELVVLSSQDAIDGAKQMENDLGIGVKTSEKRGIEDKTIDDLGTEDKTIDDFGTEDESCEDLGIKDKMIKDLGIEDKTIEDVGIEEKTIDDLGTKDKPSEDLGMEEKLIEDLGTEDKPSEDLGDDCDQKEKEPMEEEDEKRAAKRPRLFSTDEVEKKEK